jgi:MOSC domain-containing protein YiiM
VTNIFLRPSARTPVREVASAEACAGAGLEGDHARGGSRQISLIEKESWDAALSELRSENLSPGRRRANVVVEGFSLAAAFGRRIRVGECLIDIVHELAPCKLMEDVTPGLLRALSPDNRGGAYGKIVTSGRIAVGAAVELLPGHAAAPEQDRDQATGVPR